MAKTKKTNGWLLFLFLLVEAAFYTLILAGKWVVSAQYASILLCVVFVLLHLRQANYFLLFGLLCTAVSDWFLVVKFGADKLTAMLFFLVAQVLYAILLHLRARSKGLLITRLVVLVIVEAVAVLVLLGNMDALAAVSMAYYTMLIMNVICAFAAYKKEPLLAWALVLFLLCDTVIGLQQVAMGYMSLPLWLNDIVFCGFPLAWAFYLPSQVMIALCGRHNRR